MFFSGKPLPVHRFPKKPSGVIFFAWCILLLFETGSPAATVHVSGGPRYTFMAFERAGKLTTGDHLRGDSQEEGAPGFALNINVGPWFFGSDFFSGRASYRSSVVNDPSGFLKGTVDITEMNLALGFLIFREFGPFLAFTRHRQTTSGGCPGCRNTFEFSKVGPGLSLSYPFPGNRWGGYARGSYTKGYGWEAGFSYSGVRMPLMGVVGFRQRIIAYSGSEVPCREDLTGCFLSRDIISGPVFSVYYIY